MWTIYECQGTSSPLRLSYRLVHTKALQKNIQLNFVWLVLPLPVRTLTLLVHMKLHPTSREDTRFRSNYSNGVVKRPTLLHIFCPRHHLVCWLGLPWSTAFNRGTTQKPKVCSAFVVDFRIATLVYIHFFVKGIIEHMH